MTEYRLEPERSTLHGHFSPALAPVLRIEPGDSVVFRTLDVWWDLEKPPAPGAEGRRFEPRRSPDDDGHSLVGPVFVEGAEPGMTLAVHVDELVPGRWGQNLAGGRDTALNRRLGVEGGEPEWLLWDLDPEARTGTNQLGHVVRLDPFLGVLGLSPAEPGIHSTTPPRATGGNIDLKELRPGSTLHLPIAVPGGLFSTGDGHARQGDGELSGTAIECPMERARLTFDLLPGLTSVTPSADTAEGHLTMGFSEDLDEAIGQALDAMLEHMTQTLDLSRKQALALASAVVDIRITQLVNGVRGAHAVLPREAVGR